MSGRDEADPVVITVQGEDFANHTKPKRMSELLADLSATPLRVFFQTRSSDGILSYREGGLLRLTFEPMVKAPPAAPLYEPPEVRDFFRGELAPSGPAEPFVRAEPPAPARERPVDPSTLVERELLAAELNKRHLERLAAEAEPKPSRRKKRASRARPEAIKDASEASSVKPESIPDDDDPSKVPEPPRIRSRRVVTGVTHAKDPDAPEFSMFGKRNV